MSTIPKGYDAEGNPLYEDDHLDHRYDAALERITASIGRPSALMFDTGVWALLDCADVDTMREAVPVFGELVEREIERRGCPYLLDLESGADRWRQGENAKIQRHLGWPALRARFGFPEDPANLDEEQLDAVRVHLFMPHLSTNPD